MLSISSESSVEVPLQVDIHVIADGDLDLSNPPSGECEVGGVFLADRVSGVPTDAQPLAGQCKVRRLGAPGSLATAWSSICSVAVPIASSREPTLSLVNSTPRP